tara:strand:- start:447 stop:1037 length:591 start_codon:yes stop_codon:yes gene_type:complete
MAKGKSDLILRDRMQFDVDASGNVDTLYGRIDLSDYVSIPKSEGLKIKEVRFQVRDTKEPRTGSFNQLLNRNATTATFSSLKLYSTTTAYETAVDVGIGSPNVINVVEHQCMTHTIENGSGTNVGGNTLISYFEYGVPDLHPDGFPVVTDLLIGVAGENMTAYNNDTLEIDIMLIAEPVKLTKDDMEQMLTQATDL